MNIEFNKDYKVRLVKKEGGFSIEFSEVKIAPKVDFEIESVIFDTLRFKTNAINFTLFANNKLIGHEQKGDAFEAKVPFEGDVFFSIINGVGDESETLVRNVSFYKPFNPVEFEILNVIFEGVRFMTEEKDFKLFMAKQNKVPVEVSYVYENPNYLANAPFEGNVAIFIESANGVLSEMKYRNVSFANVTTPPVLPNPENLKVPFDGLRDLGTYALENSPTTNDKKKEYELLPDFDYVATAYENLGLYGKSPNFQQRFIYGGGIGDGKISPKGYFTNSKANMYDFHIRFPEFDIPKGRIFVVQGGTDNDEAMLKRGASFAENVSDPKRKFLFLGDGWLQSVGIMQWLDMSNPIHVQWVKDVDVDKMIAVFNDIVRNEKGYVMYNYEWLKSWAYSGIERQKLKKFIDGIAGRKKDFILSFWAEPRIKAIAPQNEIDIYRTIWSRLERGTLGTDKDLFNFAKAHGSLIQIDIDGLYEKLDVCHTGFYQYLVHETSHRLIIETVLAKHLYPNQKHVHTFWNDIESVGELETRNEEFEYFGVRKPVSIKARASKALGQTRGAWMMALGDGIDVWEHITWRETKEEWLRDVNPEYDPFRYPAQPLTVIDWIARGVWQVSQHNDIVEANTKWEWIVNPVESLANKGVMCAIKRSENGKEALLLAVNEFETRGGWIEYELNGIKFETHLTFTTVERILV